MGETRNQEKGNIASTHQRERKRAEIKAKVILKAKGEETYVAPQQLLVTLKWFAAVDLDMMVFYKAKDGRVGGVGNYTGGSMGSLSSFPFIQISKDVAAGVKVSEKTLRITKLDDLAEVYICVINLSDASKGHSTTFRDYDSHILVKDEKGESVAVPLNSSESGMVAVMARIENTFMGLKLVNENRVMDKATFKESIPGANLFNQ